MKEHLLGKKKRPIYFIKKAMDLYCDALVQEAKCLELRKKIHCNRALINLWLKNYGKVVEDCLKAISIDPKYIRPYVRACEAMNSLEKFNKSLKMCAKGLEIEPKNKVLLELKSEAEAGLKVQLEIERKKNQKNLKKRSVIEESCISKGIVLGNLSSFKLPEVYTVSPKSEISPYREK
jgi:tetratricopeptide (TPR) repeat protein